MTHLFSEILGLDELTFAFLAQITLFILYIFCLGFFSRIFLKSRYKLVAFICVEFVIDIVSRISTLSKVYISYVNDLDFFAPPLFQWTLLARIILFVWALVYFSRHSIDSKFS